MRSDHSLEDVNGPRDKRYKRTLKHRILIRAGFTSVVILVAALTGGGLLSQQVISVRSHLKQTIDLVPQLRAQLAGGDQKGSTQTYKAIMEHTGDARDIATGPLWNFASGMPFVGKNFNAITEVTVSADDVAARAVGPLLSTYGSLDWNSLSPNDGRINVAQIRESAPMISAAAKALTVSYERMESIDLSGLFPQVSDPIRSATIQLEEASHALQTASSTAELLPSMLGADNPRNYLVLVQNSAESRATGGIAGALVIIKADDGQIVLGEQSSATQLGAFQPPIAVDLQQTSLYTQRLGTHMQNVNLSPDFPTAAVTAKRMWEERHKGETIDGVLALDTVVLGHLLDGTGAVDLVDPEILQLVEGTALPVSLTKDNVVRTLLSSVYSEIEDPSVQDAYFAAVAGEIFKAFTNGGGNTTRLARGLDTSIKENRLYLWSGHKEEQTILDSTELAGSAVGQRVGGTSFGVYFNDGTGAKMDYYARRTVQLIKSCPTGGYSSYTVRVKISNNAPLDASSSLPSYVTGNGMFGVDPGNIRTNYVFYGPAHSFAESATVDGKAVPIGSGKHGERPVGTVTLELRPGESAEMDVIFTRVVQDSDPRVRVTPTTEPSDEVMLPFTKASCS